MPQPERDRSRRRHGCRLASVVATCSLAVLLQASPAAADVKAVSATATGVAVTGDLGVIPPTPTVSLAADETSPTSALGPFTDSAPSVTLASSLPFNVFSTGALSVTATAGNLAGEAETGFVEARTLVQNVVLGPNIAAASSIASSCRGDDHGARGATVIQGGMLNGQPFPPTPNPAPDTVIPVAGLGTVTLNEQVVTTGTGPTGDTTKVVVNAVHARFASGAEGILPRDQTAEAIIGQVTCEVTAMAPAPPSPTTVAPTPAAEPPARPRGSLATTGSEHDMLPLGLLALGLSGVLRLVLGSRRGGRA